MIRITLENFNKYSQKLPDLDEGRPLAISLGSTQSPTLTARGRSKSVYSILIKARMMSV
jgi:hypothetical protein